MSPSDYELCTKLELHTYAGRLNVFASNGFNSVNIQFALQGQVWENTVFPEHVYVPRLPGVSHVLRVHGLPGHARHQRLSRSFQ